MTNPPNESAPAETEATSNLTHFKNSAETAVGSAFSFQPEIDVLDKINAAQLVYEAFTTGHLADVEAVSTISQAVRRAAHHALVARINRGL